MNSSSAHCSSGTVSAADAMSNAVPTAVAKSISRCFGAVTGPGRHPFNRWLSSTTTNRFKVIWSLQHEPLIGADEAGGQLPVRLSLLAYECLHGHECVRAW